MTDNEYRQAHWHSSCHRTEILASAVCGCFYCLKTYPPESITNWYTESNDKGQTAFCPCCGIDSVIGSASGYNITADFLLQMKQRWF